MVITGLVGTARHFSTLCDSQRCSLIPFASNSVFFFLNVHFYILAIISLTVVCFFFKSMKQCKLAYGNYFI